MTLSMGEGNMIAKALSIAVVAGALSVPLAGMAWADPSDTDGNGLGSGGVPKKIAQVLEQNGGPAVDRVVPGTGYGPNIYGTSDLAKLPGSVPGVLGSLNPGDFVTAVTPGCGSSDLGCH
jgi:hypothetical protein